MSFLISRIHAHFNDSKPISQVSKKTNKIEIIKNNISFSPITEKAVNFKKVEFINCLEVTNESGSAPQMKVKLVSEIGETIVYGRIKQIKTLNEAIIYHKMHRTDPPDPLAKFTPSYFGVFDAHGKPIDLDKELKLVENGKKQMEDLYREHPTAWIMMKDVTSNLPEQVKVDRLREIQDYKFVRKGLILNQDEINKHGHTKRSKFYTKVRKSLLSQSNCSFALQKSTKSKWYSWAVMNIKRVFEIKETKQKLQSQFLALGPQELRANIEKLEELRTAVHESNFTFNDSSLLIVPTIYQGHEGISISLIDLGHGMAKNEGIKNFEGIKKEIEVSITELIEMLKTTLEPYNHFS